MRALVIAFVLLAAPRAAEACFLDAVSGMSFGNYDPLSNTSRGSTATITLRCLVSLSVKIDLSTGGGTYAQRRMTKTGGQTLDYQLYMDSALQQVWGDGTGGTSHYGPVIALVATVLITIYGDIPVHQNAPAGAYSDTVVVTLSY